MSHGFLAFVDESGSEGPAEFFEFLVISAVVMRADDYQFVSSIYDRARRVLGKKPCWNFPKFIKHNSDQQKYLISQLIAEAPFGICTIIAHKPSVTSLDMKDKPGNLYFFLSQLLLERISWMCRDAHRAKQSGNGVARIVFSERQSLSYQDFRYYVGFLRNNQGAYNSNTEWAHIDPALIVASEQEACEGLRLADFAASAFARAIEFKEFGLTDDRYIRPWDRLIYRWKDKCLRNGLKIFPTAAEADLLGQQRFLWFHNYYRK